MNDYPQGQNGHQDSYQPTEPYQSSYDQSIQQPYQPPYNQPVQQPYRPYQPPYNPYQQYPYQQPMMSVYDPGKGLGTASFVLGLIGTLSFGYGIVLGIIGLILGIMSKNRSREAGLQPGGLSKAGVVLSIIAISLFAFILVAVMIPIMIGVNASAV